MDQAIDEAIKNNDLRQLKSMYKSYISEYSISRDTSPLMRAAELGHLEIVKYLCEIVDINQTDQIYFTVNF